MEFSTNLLGWLSANSLILSYPSPKRVGKTKINKANIPEPSKALLKLFVFRFAKRFQPS